MVALKKTVVLFDFQSKCWHEHFLQKFNHMQSKQFPSLELSSIF